ncbi:glutaminyl-peptide cyclotransferase [Microbulbifer thermotolerans]|uniref:Glutaminyl-peptide cyclotransferase n=1 Tax=Microbulbifer thermotolerans TaxID=252514 RepID=A0AB35HVR1_MICTH|nr:glutaminyl-peptide cyclotransferase [Microbulbifer thermotolerans]MCX2782641.1 glutaminyl-peptide cyclotransferase [Microbulbifer thermotolerans]MCX2801481.1 glutaminyl-peptide cyclotransferase [Microbulbifer thermotolerans]
MRKFTILFLLLLSPLTLAETPPSVPFSVLEERQRPADHFTQGLYFDGQRWWESSGLYGRSWLAEYSDPGASPLRRKWLAENRFAEGLTVFGDRLYLLTWKAGEVQIYRAADLSPLGLRRYAGEGWGLTSDGEHLIMSNGSGKLTFRDPETFAVLRSVEVHGGGEKWKWLNELEYANGLIWANIWQDSRLIAIDPKSGEVRGLIDLKQLTPSLHHPDAVANGIAWDRVRNGLWVTGKYWPKLYLIQPHGLGFAPRSKSAPAKSTAPGN